MIYKIDIVAGNNFKDDVDILRALLVNYGISETEIVEYNDKNKIYLEIFFKSLKKAVDLKNKIRINNFRNFKISLKSLKKIDWQEAWKKSFKPFRLTKNIYVVPAWLKKKYKVGSKQVIFIDSNLAFGTGLHESTKLISKLVEEKKGKFNSFLDIGTGTGILSILALKNGAQDVVAIENDCDAYQTAKLNFKNNGQSTDLIKVVDFKEFNTNKRFDFIAANLNSADLVSMAKRIIFFLGPKKYLAVSGVSIENYKYLRDGFNSLSLRCLRILKGKEWVAILFQNQN